MNWPEDRFSRPPFLPENPYASPAYVEEDDTDDPEQDGITPTRVPLAALFEEAAVSFQQNFGRLFLPFLMVYALVWLFKILLYIGPLAFGSMMGQTYTTEEVWRFYQAGNLDIFMWIFALWLMMGLWRHHTLVLRGYNVDLSTVFSTVLPFFWGIVYTFFMGLAMLPGVLFWLFYRYISPWTVETEEGVMGVVILGIVLMIFSAAFLVPGYWLMANKDVGAFRALRYSLGMTLRNFFTVLGSVLLLAMLCILLFCLLLLFVSWLDFLGLILFLVTTMLIYEFMNVYYVVFCVLAAGDEADEDRGMFETPGGLIIKKRKRTKIR